MADKEGRGMSRYNRCKECYNMKCVFVTGEREDFDTSECPNFRGMTNADRIRGMTDEELADMFWEFMTDSVFVNPYRAKTELLDWLKQEARDD